MVEESTFLFSTKLEFYCHTDDSFIKNTTFPMLVLKQIKKNHWSLCYTLDPTVHLDLPGTNCISSSKNEYFWSVYLIWPKGSCGIIVDVCLYTSHSYFLKNNSMDVTQTYHAVTLFFAWHLAFLAEMTDNPNKVYDGEKTSWK